VELFEAIAKRVGLSEEKTNIRLPNVQIRSPEGHPIGGSQVQIPPPALNHNWRFKTVNL